MSPCFIFSKVRLNMNKVKIRDTMYDVVSLEEYINNKELYLPRYTAIHDQENGLVLPIKTQSNETDTCISVESGMSYVLNLPEDTSEFSDKNIIDLENNSSIGELIKKQDMVRGLERDILMAPDPDDIFRPKIFDDDAGEMKALKEAVICKGIDLDKYAPRFGANFNNDKRLFNKPTISLAMLKRMCEALDIEASISLKDKSSTVPNPIGKTIEVKLTGISEEDSE